MVYNDSSMKQQVLIHHWLAQPQLYWRVTSHNWEIFYNLGTLGVQSNLGEAFQHILGHLGIWSNLGEAVQHTLGYLGIWSNPGESYLGYQPNIYSVLERLVNLEFIIPGEFIPKSLRIWEFGSNLGSSNLGDHMGYLAQHLLNWLKNLVQFWGHNSWEITNSVGKDKPWNSGNDVDLLGPH